MARERMPALRTVGLDMVGPLVVYRVCRSAGLPTVWSLVISGASPGLGVLIDWVRWRTLEVVGAVVLTGILLSVVLAVISNDAKVVLLEGAATTALFGVGCLVSLSRKRPLIFYFAQTFYGGRHSTQGAFMESEFDEFETARWFWRRVTVVWALAYFVEAAALAVLVQTVSTGTALAFNRVGTWVVSGLLIGWAIWWGNRLRALKPAAEQEPVAG